MDAAAAEQAQQPGAEASGSPGSGAATRLLLLLSLSPWEAGCSVPPTLAPLMWAHYCQHTAREWVHSLGTGRLDPGQLAAAVAEACDASPTTAHALQLANEVLDQPGLHAKGAEAALQAAQALLALPLQQPGPELSARRQVLAAALASAGWQALQCKGSGSELRGQLLGVLRSLLASNAHLVRLLVDSCCVPSEMRSMLYGTQSAGRVGRGCEGADLLSSGPRGARGGRVRRAFRSSFRPGKRGQW